MSTKKASVATAKQTQEVCIDLPGESVQCWRSSDNVKVILRKHRDVFFDINLKKDAIYTVESTSDFYSPREKKLLRRASFFDGERFNIWVGREFAGRLVLKLNGAVLGQYEVNKLDTTSYGIDPKAKPEPLMVIMGHKAESESFTCTPNDPFGLGRTQLVLLPTVNPKLPILTDVGSQFRYALPPEQPEIKEYAVVAEVQAKEIQPQVLKQLEAGAVSGNPTDIFNPPQKGDEDSLLYKALGAAFSHIAGNETLTSNWFKETAGYAQENWRSFNKFAMTVRIEKKAKGKYVSVIKGKPVTGLIAQALGAGKEAKVSHHRAPVGSKTSKFMDGGFGKSGKAGYGGARRMLLTTSENFRGGLKIQVIGTVIDLFVDVNSVYFDEKGSGDLSEFLGRAGVSIMKAGATAALGSVIAAVVTAGAPALFAAAGIAVPVLVVAVLVVAGYILAATIVDNIDNEFGIKQSVANAAR